MPEYQSNDDLPDDIKEHLPDHAQNIYREAIAELKQTGFSNDISLIAVDKKSGEVKSHQVKQDIADGVEGGAIAGGILGGITGILTSIGTVLIPGIGTVLIAGPLAVMLGLSGTVGGALTGGLVGALVDAGVPDKKAREYVKSIKRGEVLVTVTANHESEERVRAILDKYGAFEHNIQHKKME